MHAYMHAYIAYIRTYISTYIRTGIKIHTHILTRNLRMFSLADMQARSKCCQRKVLPILSKYACVKLRNYVDQF